MKKAIFKRIGATLLACVMSAGLICTSASATTADEFEGEVHEVLTGDGLARGSGLPQMYFSLSNDNYYTASLEELRPDTGSYTLYYFVAGTGNLFLQYNLKGVTEYPKDLRTLNFELYERVPQKEWELKTTRTVSFKEYTDGRLNFTNLSTKNFYCFRFFNDSSEKVTDRVDISGTILIDDTFI